MTLKQLIKNANKKNSFQEASYYIVSELEKNIMIGIKFNI